MRVLVACEFSGIVRDAFIERGHDAVSADFEPTERPGPHIQGDVTPLLEQPWDLVIAHPPCTYLANSGVQYIHKYDGRRKQMEDAADFFLKCLNANAPLVAVENPTMHKYAIDRIGRKSDFWVSPHHFGHAETKRTCFWTRGLPPLMLTGINTDASVGWMMRMGPSDTRAKERSRTFTGIADAMANQWG